MMVYNAINSQRENVIKTPHLGSMEEGKESRAKQAENDNLAATFRRSQKGDYQGKKLSPLQESIMNLQDQIQKVKNNDKIGSEKKDELLKTMDQQLRELEKQLSEENVKTNEEDTAGSVKKKANSNEDAMGNGENAEGQDEISSLIAVGTSLDQVKSAGAAAEQNEGKAKLAQYELDDAVKKERLTDKNIISKRQGEIDEMKNVGKKLFETVDEIRERQGEKVEEEMPDVNSAETVESNKGENEENIEKE